PENAWSLDAHVTPIDRLTLGLEWTWIGRRVDVLYDNAGDFSNAAGLTPGYNIGALYGTFDITPEAQLFARVDNVLDTTYEQPAAFAGAPETVMVGIRVRD